MARSLSDALMRKSGHFSGRSLIGTLTSQNGRAASVSAEAVAIDIITASMFEVSRAE